MKEILVGYKKVHIKKTDKDAYIAWLNFESRGGVGLESHQAWLDPNDLDFDLDDVDVPCNVDVVYDYNKRIDKIHPID